MRELEFNKLILDGLRDSLKSANKPLKEPSRQLLKSAFFYLSNQGIDDDGIKTLMPYVVKYLVDQSNPNKDGLKTHLGYVIETLQMSTITAEPERLRNPAAMLERRRDLLARLLAPKESNTPCLAIAFHQGQLVVAYNSPTKFEVTNDSIESNLQKKLNLIRECLFNANSLLQRGKKDEIHQLITSTRDKIFEIDDYSTSMLPIKRRGKKRETLEQYFDMALLKLLGSVSTPTEKGGFTQSELDALLLSDNVVLLSPIFEKEKKATASLHAEQMIAQYIVSNSKPGEEPTYIGVSKLCCANCRDVLQATPEVRFRGSHGGNFPNIMDVRSGEQMPANRPVKNPETLYASDSESEGELNDDHRYDFTAKEEKKLTPPKETLTQSSFTLFAQHTRPLTVPSGATQLKENEHQNSRRYDQKND